MSETPKRIYKDRDGQPIRLLKLIKAEPEWAENQILHRDKLEKELAETKEQLKSARTIARESLDQMGRDTEASLKMETELAEAWAELARWKIKHETAWNTAMGLKAELEEARAEVEKRKDSQMKIAGAQLCLMIRHAFMDGALIAFECGTEKNMRQQYFNEWAVKNYPDAVDASMRQENLVKQMFDTLERSLKDMDRIDEVCNLAGVHKFDLMRLDLESAIEAAKGGK